MPLHQQVMIIFVAVNGYLDDMPIEQVKPFEEGFHKFMDEKYPDVGHSIAEELTVSDNVEETLKKGIEQYKAAFTQSVSA
jgi:F-type H+-transporting ATPase subunit alpha